VNALHILLIAACLMVPGIAVADTYQLWLEIFDEGRATTVCKYRSNLGKQGEAEYPGRHLCPRVACKIPPAEHHATATINCSPAAVTPVGSARRPTTRQLMAVRT
jgi:hypothetical protein